jgi:hypothetical protein
VHELGEALGDRGLAVAGSPKRKIDLPEFTAGPSCSKMLGGITRWVNAASISERRTTRLRTVWREHIAR